MREDWIEVELGDLLKLKNGFAFKAKDYIEEGIPVFRIGDIKDWVVTGENAKHIIEDEIYDGYIVENGDILIAMSGATTGKFGIYNSEQKAYQNQRVGNLKLYSEININKSFVFYLLYSLKRKIEEDAYGGAQPNISSSKIEALKTNLAPLPIQRAIVSKIETLFSDLDNGIANLKKAQAQLKIYRQAVLKKAFEGELTKKWREQQSLSGVKVPTADELLIQIKEERQNHYNNQIEEWKEAVKEWEKKGKEGKKPTIPKKGKEISPLTNEELKPLFKLQKGITWRKIGETCTVKGGKRLPKGQDFSREKTSYKYIMAGNLKNGTVSNEVNYINKVTYDALYHYRVNKGDVYMTIVGACIGDAGVIPEVQHLSILTENAAKIICTSRLSSKYLSFWLNSLVAQIRIKQSIFSMTLGKLALSRIEEIEFPHCSIEEQNQIVQEIESRLSVCDKVEQSITESLEKAKALRQSILKKAFEGKLLSTAEIEACKQKADYEPASVLLEKIKAEKAKAQEPASKKNKKTTKKKITRVGTSKPKISTDIQAGLISKVIKLHNDHPEHLNNLTHIKCEKISHLVEAHLQIPLGRIPVKDAAGPDDYPHLKKVEHRASMAGYFSVKKLELGHTYLPSRNISKAIENLEKKLSESQNEQINSLIKLFLNFDLESAEIVATLYAGWNNLLLEGKTPTDDEIVYESRENWSPRKLKINRERFFKALNWMREDDIALIPKGCGVKVLKPKNKATK